MARRKVQWNVDDVFVVPLEGGERLIGQVIGKSLDTMRSALCAFTLVQADATTAEIEPADYISVQFTTKDMLERGGWAIIGRLPTPTIDKYFDDFETLEKSSFFGVTVRGSGVMRKFLEACQGHRAWDSMHDPNYFDKLLLPNQERPTKVVFSK